MSNPNLSLASVVHSAASSFEERELIAAIVNDLSNLQARIAYRDWLEARDDKRSVPVRDLITLVEQVFHGEPPQRSYSFFNGYSKSWLDIQGFSLLADMVLHPELIAAKDIFLRYALPTLDIQPEAVPPEGLLPTASRFGGRATLPEGMPWPTSHLGPLGFVGQIALAEIQHTQAARVLPAEGWLSFFVFDDHVGAGRGDTESGGDSAVLYFPPNSKLDWRDPPAILEFAPWGNGVCRLIFTESWDLPDQGDLVVSEDDRSRLHNISRDFDFDEYRNPWRKGDSHLLGYARHYRTSDPSPARDWRNLLCLGSTAALGWNWCDGEHLALFIANKDLDEHRFDRVFGYAS